MQKHDIAHMSAELDTLSSAAWHAAHAPSIDEDAQDWYTIASLIEAASNRLKEMFKKKGIAQR